MKRIITMVIALALTLSLLAACTQGEQPKTSIDATPGAPAVATPAADAPVVVPETVKLNFYREGTLADDRAAQFADNKVLQYIKENTGVELEFTYIAGAEGKQKMILAFAGGDYPDGGWLDWNTMMSRSDIMKYGVQEGILLPLNDLIDEHGTELNAIFVQRPQHKALITAPDGNIYGIPRFSECGHCMSYPKMWFNYDWLEKLNISEPQTTDELYEALKTIKTSDVNGNGIADEVALTGGIEYSTAVEYWLMNSFIYTPAQSHSTNPRPFLNLTDGKVTFVANKPEYKEGLEYIKKLYDEGLIDPANFTQNSEGLQQQCRTSDLPTVAAYTADHLTMGIDFGGDKTIADAYHALPPVAGPGGVRFQSYSSALSQLSGYNFVLFDTCSDPVAAYKMADFLLSEYNTFVGHYGIEGVSWGAPEDTSAKNILGGPLKAIPTEWPKDDEAKSLLREQNSFWIPFIADLYERRAMWMPEATDDMVQNNYETRLHWETQRTAPYWPTEDLPRNLYITSEDADEYGELLLNISQHVVKNTSMFITGARPLSDWDKYIAELNQYGLERYITIFDNAYQGFLSH